jgi:uncharacterized membrane protein
MPRAIGIGMGPKFKNKGGASVVYDMTLTWDGDTTDPTPDFDLTEADDLQEGDVMRLTINSTDYDNTLDAGELASLNFAFASGSLANGSYTATAYHLRGGSTLETSNTVNVTINDTTAPVLSSITDTKTGITTGTGSVTTTKATGTLYWVLSSSASAPSAAQVKAGQMHTGAAAAKSGSQAVSATGAQALSFTGLTGGTTYYLHAMHEDIGPNQSSVGSGDGLTTDPANPFTYLTNQVSNRTFDQPTASFTVNATSTGELIMAVATYTTTISGITVDGNAATLVIQSTTGLGSQIGLYRYAVGSTGNKTVVVTGSSNLGDTVLGYGIMSGLNTTPTATERKNPAFNNTPIVMFSGASVPSGGVGIGASYSENNTTAIVVSSATQHCDVDTGGGSGPKRFAMYSISADADPSVAFAAFNGDGHVMAAWGP